MMLVQKQISHFAPPPSPYNLHRRHPSAPPPVVVQPTRTPGLLSLSKPAPKHQLPQQRSRQSPKAKHAVAVRSEPARAVQTAVAPLKPAAEITEKRASTATPSPEKLSSRGRQHVKPKDKVQRSTSHSSVRTGRRSHARQSSPPIESPPSPSQAEVPAYKSTISNPFDPFMDDSASPAPASKTERSSVMTLASRPSGKLARRRQPSTNNSIPFSTTPSRAIPVPKRTNSFPVSRSVPVLGGSHIPPRSTTKAAKRSSGPPSGFPICDDMTDAGEDTEQEIYTPLATPTRAPQGYDNGPRTAPLTTSSTYFPFSSTPSPSPKAQTVRARKHKRSPSEGIFNMSSDEDVLATGSSADLKALFGLLGAKPTMSQREAELEEIARKELNASFFASSMFQNSPSPEDLPPPMF